MLLYIHVPFCRKKCAYCAFYSLALPAGRPGADLMGSYLALLLTELRRRAEELKHPALESVYFGGGTPSLLPPAALKGILAEVRKHFSLAPDAEISAEANPDSALDQGWLFEARAAGVNRLSLGVQSFDDANLRMLGRLHEARAAEAAFMTARDAAFKNISLDFMWGLPGARRPQAQRDWLDDLRRAGDLRPDHLSAYCLTLEPQSPLALAVKQGALSMPDERASGAMYLAGAELLESLGLMQYEIANFARMGFQCRHSLGYWEGRDYLGLGPGAVSTLEGTRQSNPPDMDAWREVLATGQGRTLEKLTRADALKERLMLSLRTVAGLDLALWKRLSGRSFMADNAKIVALLQQKGLASPRRGRFKLTRNGMLVADAILARIFADMEME